MIVVAGEALIDLLVRPDGPVSATPGGGPFNTARTIGRLGGEVAFLGCLSTDRFGARLRDALAGDGVDLSMIETTDAPTTLAVADLDARRRGHLPVPHRGHVRAAPVGRCGRATRLRHEPAAVHVGTLGLVLEPMAAAIAGAMPAVSDRRRS